MSIFFKAMWRDSRLGNSKLKILGILNDTNDGLFKILLLTIQKISRSGFLRLILILIDD